ncbi:MAG: DUF1573 domain-containing protein [Bacteroidota bacterium]
MNKVKVFSLFLLIFGNVYAQDTIKKITQITFENTSFDFGVIKEEGGLVEHEFKFTNTGQDTLRLTNVHASCGCTTPNWTKDPVAPGLSGVIRVTYNPLHRPNKFSKAIFVSANTEPEQTTLMISGNVTPKPRTLKDDYPFAMGNLWLSTNHKALLDVLNTQTKTDTIFLYNNWGRIMKVSVENIPEHLKIKFSTDKIKPNTKAFLLITYDATKRKDWGLVYDKFEIKTNDTIEPAKLLNVSANIKENFSAWTPQQIKNAPKFKISSNSIDFGVKKVGEIFTIEAEIENTGVDDLIIRKNTAYSSCLIGTLSSEVVKAGEKVKLTLKVDLTNRPGKFNKSITLLLNDPSNSSINVFVKGEVEKN